MGRLFYMRIRVLWCCAVLAGLNCPVYGHPVPLRCPDRKITVHLTPAGLIIHYRLEVDTLTIIQDDLASFEDQIVNVTRPEGFYAAFARVYGPLVGNYLWVTLDGVRLDLIETHMTYRLTDENGEPLDH